MKNFLLLFVLLICSLKSFSQDTAYVLVNPEKTYPYDEHSNNKEWSWKFNQQPVTYKSGKYAIPIHSGAGLDTLEIIRTLEVAAYPKVKKPQKILHTSSRKVLCKFHGQHSYALSQIFPGSFNVFSLGYN